MAHRFGLVGLSKWQIALLIGTPIVIGIGVYLFKKTSAEKRATDENDKTKITLERKENSNSKTGEASLDGKNEGTELEHKKKNAELENEELSPLKEATMYKNEGNNFYRRRKYDEAISFYDKAIDKCPKENQTDLAIFYQNRAASYEMLKNWNCVIEDCSRSLEYNPRYAKAYFRRAKAYEKTNDLQECLNDLTATCILEDYQNNKTILFADRILKEIGREDTDRYMENFVPILPSKDFLKRYLNTFVSDPIKAVVLPSFDESVPLYGFARAKHALELNKFEEVISACTEEIESSESQRQYKSEALLLRGTFHMLSGAFNEAQQDLGAVVNNDDADVKLRASALGKRAAVYMQLEDYHRGLADFQAAEIFEPDNPDIYYQRALFYALLDQTNEALIEFNKALKLSPNNAMAYVQKCYAEYRVALVAQDQMRITMVMKKFKNAIEKFPTCVECYSFMAQVVSEQQLFSQAEKFYEKAVAMNPENPSFYMHQASLALQWTGDIDKAISLINHALEVDDRCLLAYETLGRLEVQRANLKRGVELFEKAIKLAKSRSKMSHLFALRNAAIAQINVTVKLGIDISTRSALGQSGVMSTPLAY